MSSCGAQVDLVLMRPTAALTLRAACRNSLVSAGWTVRQTVPIGPSPRRGPFTADLLASWPPTGKKVAVFPRSQTTSGSAEEKIPFHIIKIQIAVAARPDSIQATYLVLEGVGWTYRDFYISGELEKFISMNVPTHCVTFEKFQELVFDGLL